MTDYNFLNLSPYEFEILTRDLLQKHLGCFVESFTSGADNGIDLRCSIAGKTIIQCKRYKDFSQLFRSLKKESAKLITLSPDRYIVVTSVELNPQRKDKILNLFTPFVLSTSDIIGKEDLNNLLTRFPEVERDHYKLWLSSVNILQQIINRKIVNQSKFVLDEIKDKIKVYVQNKSFSEAIELLRKERYVVVSGIPGIGKTTLAEIIVFDLLAKGVEDFIYLSDSIQEGFKMYEEERTQVFLFDDFLGRNFLENSINTNDESLIVKFISRIKKSKNKYLVITTREYVLKQAKQRFDILESVDFVKCVIDLSKYTSLVKAKILYNHLFFNGAPIEYIKEIKTQNYLLKIIEHTNYSPRIIETFTQKKLWDEYSAASFPKALFNMFENPEAVWKHAFENSISQNARVVMFVFLINKSGVEYSKLYGSVLNFSEQFGIKYSINFNSLSFKRSVKELEGTFISINMEQGKQYLISYQNPSIQDFLVNYVNKDESIKEDLIESIVYLESALRIFAYSDFDSDLRNKLTLSKDQFNLLKNVLYCRFDSIIYDGYLSTFDSEEDIIIKKLFSIDKYLKTQKGDRQNEFVCEKLAQTLYSKKINNSCVYFIILIIEYKSKLTIDLYSIMEHLVGIIQDPHELLEFANLLEIDEEAYNRFFVDKKMDCNNMIDGVVDSLTDGVNDNYDEIIEDLERINDEFDYDVDDHINDLLEQKENASINDDIEYDYWEYKEHENAQSNVEESNSNSKPEFEFESVESRIDKLFDSYE